jgi:Hypothetical protein (DUF2513)
VKRDMELVRKIVLKLEDSPTSFTKNLSIDGYSEEQIRYHNALLLEAGWIRGYYLTNKLVGPEAIATGLTWNGHDFADASRDDSRWNKVLAKVRDKGTSVTLDVLKDLLISMMRQTFES